MDEKEIIKLLIDIHSQLAVLADRVDSNRWVLALFATGTATFFGAVWAIFTKKYKNFKETIRGELEKLKSDREGDIRRNNEAVGTVEDRMTLIGKTNIEYDRLIHDIIEDGEHHKEMARKEFDTIRKICDERHGRKR